MFERTLTLLLEGEFVCDVRYPESARFLADSAHRQAAEDYLGKLGRRLACTSGGEAWFAAYREIGTEERQKVRTSFNGIKQQLRPLVGFCVTVMQALNQNQALAPGDLIDVNRLMGVIAEHAGLRDEIQGLAGLGKGATGEGALREGLVRLLKKLRDDGYLILANPEREIYSVTGKIAYFYMVVDFLVDLDTISEEVESEEEADGAQGALLL
jgi:hypothetical protein